MKALLQSGERPLRFLANRFLLTMRKHPNLTAEAAFSRTLPLLTGRAEPK